jgi:hypothetical protein
MHVGRSAASLTVAHSKLKGQVARRAQAATSLYQTPSHVVSAKLKMWRISEIEVVVEDASRKHASWRGNSPRVDALAGVQNHAAPNIGHTTLGDGKSNKLGTSLKFLLVVLA